MSFSKLAESESDVQRNMKERKEGKWIVENNLEGYAWCLRCEDWVKDTLIMLQRFM